MSKLQIRNIWQHASRKKRPKVKLYKAKPKGKARRNRPVIIEWILKGKVIRKDVIQRSRRS